MPPHQQDIVRQLAELGFSLVRPDLLDDTAETAEWMLWSWGDDFSAAFSHVLAYDAEWVDHEEVYANLATAFATATGHRDRLSELDAVVDLEELTGHLRYRVDGRAVDLTFEQDDDWISEAAFEQLFADFGDVPGRTAMYLDGGQAGLIAWVPSEKLAAFGELFPQAETYRQM